MIPLTIAISDYDHVRDLTSGRVRVEGIELTHLQLVHEEIFFRFTAYREWEVTELSLAKYCALVAAGDSSVTAIPVFPSRVFRHSSIYVRADGPVGDPAALAGARIGIPEWVQTAGVYVRGILAHDFGIDLGGVRWFQSGVSDPGRQEQFEVPAGIDLTVVRDRNLNQLLLEGALDAVISARPPAGAVGSSPNIVRLFEDHVAREQEWFARTRIHPIMHVIALRKDVVDRHPWIARNLYQSFVAARDRGLARALDATASRVPVPWLPDHAGRVRELLGGELFPYGLENNRPTLDAFLDYAAEQGVTSRRLRPEELFIPEVEVSAQL